MTNEYSIVDVGCVSYLFAKGYKHTALRPTGHNGQLAFIFAGPEIQAEIDGYYSGAVISAQRFWEAAKVCKATLYGAKECYHKGHEDFRGAK